VRLANQAPAGIRGGLVGETPRVQRLRVIGEDRDEVVGILLAKDLLRYVGNETQFDLRRLLRPAVLVPESKRLNILLRDFRASRNHMAIVVDEYGGVAGLVTIEDVIEPFLIQQGFLQRTPRGRIATLAAYRHLGVTAPAAMQNGAGLFGGDNE
jgi:hypothetical protein